MNARSGMGDSLTQYIGQTFEDAELAGWRGAGWYFWDESLSHCYGPYTDQLQAIHDRNQYYEALSRGRE